MPICYTSEVEYRPCKTVIQLAFNESRLPSRAPALTRRFRACLPKRLERRDIGASPCGFFADLSALIGTHQLSADPIWI